MPADMLARFRRSVELIQRYGLTQVGEPHVKHPKGPLWEMRMREFSLTAAMIEARNRAGLTQKEVAKRMKTTQAAIARLESAGSKPSTRTLVRYAKATGTRLRISFEPERAVRR